MGTVRQPDEGYLFCGFISSDKALIEKANSRFISSMSCGVLFESPYWGFSKRTSYYRNEMGDNLVRKFFVYDLYAPVGRIVSAKLLSNEIEAEFQDAQGNRRVNMDPGWLSAAKFILASTKNYSHRIHLDKGIYADLTFFYQNNNWQSLPWTYPDYKEDYRFWFLNARKILFNSQKK